MLDDDRKLKGAFFKWKHLFIDSDDDGPQVVQGKIEKELARRTDLEA